MANLSVCAFIIPDGVETTSGVSSSIYPLTTMVTNYLALVLVEGSVNSLDRRLPFFFGWFRREFGMRLLLVFLSSGITRLVLGIVPIGIFPRTPSFTNLSSVDAPDPLTGHSYLLHTPHAFVLTRRLTCVQGVPLPLTYSYNCLSSSVCNLMRRRPIHLPPLAYGAQRSPLIYPADWTRSDGRPRRIRCYMMCFVHSGLGCWDATTQAACDDTASERRGWTGVLSVSFEVCVCQGRVTPPCNSFQGVCSPNRILPCRNLNILKSHMTYLQ